MIAAGETDVPKVIDSLIGPVPGGRRVFYQKHMSHHLLPGVPRNWLRHVTNCFLIREPREVLTSLVMHVPDVTILHLLGPDHLKLTFRFQGRDFRLTDVHGNLVPKLFAEPRPTFSGPQQVHSLSPRPIFHRRARLLRDVPRGTLHS